MSRQGAVALLTLLIVQWVLSTVTFAQTLIVPSLSVSERYDSNIFFAPKSLLRPDAKPEDFITTVIPQLNLIHQGSLMSGTLTGTGLMTKYLHNSSRDFIGWNVGGRLDLANAAHRVSQRITSLTVRGTYRSTPITTGFGTAGTGGTSGTAGQRGWESGVHISRKIYPIIPLT